MNVWKNKRTDKHWLWLLGIIACTSTLPAHATLITFDDLNAEPICDWDICVERTLSNEYADLGVIFGEGASISARGSQPGGNHVISNYWVPGLIIQFTGILPTFVSVEISTEWQESAYVEIYGVDSYITTLRTEGGRWPDETSTPYRPNQIVSFAGTEISMLKIADFMNFEGSLLVDNLRFEYSPVEISEPSMLGLLVGGLGLLAWQRRRRVY